MKWSLPDGVNNNFLAVLRHNVYIQISQSLKLSIQMAAEFKPAGVHKLSVCGGYYPTIYRL